MLKIKQDSPCWKFWLWSKSMALVNDEWPNFLISSSSGQYCQNFLLWCLDRCNRLYVLYRFKFQFVFAYIVISGEIPMFRANFIFQYEIWPSLDPGIWSEKFFFFFDEEDLNFDDEENETINLISYQPHGEIKGLFRYRLFC